jgi:hypothetical protein
VDDVDEAGEFAIALEVDVEEATIELLDQAETREFELLERATLEVF